MQFFERLKINTDFFQYGMIIKIFKNLLLLSPKLIVNDIAERGVKLIEEYNTKITHDEIQKQYLL